MFKHLTTLAVSLGLLVAVSAPAAAYEGLFSDVPATHWAAETVETASKKGLMQGTGDGRFGLEESITRSAFVTVLCRMFSWPLLSPVTPTFSDVPVAEWYYPSVETAAAHGVLPAGDRFRPTDFITRADMAEMLVRALGYGPLEATVANLPSPFSDVSGNGFINIAYDVGMTVGSTAADGTAHFNPYNRATREEAAAMLLRVYDRYTQKIDWLHAFYYAGSYPRMDLTANADGVSVCWAKMEYDPIKGAVLNTTKANGNSWREPADSYLVTDVLAQNGTTCNLAVSGTTGKSVTLPDGTKTNVVAAILATKESRKQAIDLLVAAVSVPKYSGLNMDFEGLKSADTYKANYTAFMGELRAALPPDKTLYVCVQPSDWYFGFDFKALGEICDKVILMAHDYRHSFNDSYIGTTKTDNPDSPLTRVYGALRQITDPVTGVQDRSKIALAISFANSAIEVDKDNKMLSTTVYGPTYDVVAKRLKQKDTVIDYNEAYGTSHAFYYGDDGERYSLWYEDALSVTAKVKLARMFGINGISVWFLGSVPTDNTPGLNYNAWTALLNER
ncbi:MAG: S-layer homology domain-containing protein [Oscillospiraceae bacterium]